MTNTTHFSLKTWINVQFSPQQQNKKFTVVCCILLPLFFADTDFLLKTHLFALLSDCHNNVHLAVKAFCLGPSVSLKSKIKNLFTSCTVSYWGNVQNCKCILLPWGAWSSKKKIYAQCLLIYHDFVMSIE